MPVQWDGSGSTATREGAQLTFTWAFTALPPLSRATLNDPHLAKPSFTPDATGTFSVRLTIDDGILSATAAKDVLVADDCRPAPALTATPAAPGVGETVQLGAATTSSCSGTSSTIVRFKWSFAATPAGSRAAILQPNTAKTSFVADVRGTYDVLLEATDSLGLTSDPAAATSHLVFDVKACGDNVPVITAITSTPAQPNVQSLVVLAATVTHADTGPACNLARTFAYAWRLVGLPAGSKAALNNAAVGAPSFIADLAGTYVVALVVTDDLGHASAQQQLSFTTTQCGGNVPTGVAQAPVSAATGEVIQLHTQVSNLDNPSLDGVDPLGGTGTPTAGQCAIPLTYAYSWRLVQAPLGSRAQLSGTALANPSLRPDVAGPYAVSVVVTASTGRSSAPSAATITVGACGSLVPTIDSFVLPTSPVTGAALKVSANVSDANGACASAVGSALPLSYSWALSSAPPGSQAVLSGTAADGRTSEVSPGFKPDLPGDYGLELRVTNRLGLASALGTSTLTVANCNAPLGFANPSVPIIAPAGIVTGGVVQLSTSPTDPNDPAGTSCLAPVAPFTYAWTLAGQPEGSTAALNNPSASAPSFTADRIGPYTVQLVVTDAAGNRSPRVERTIVAADCTAPLTVTGLAPAAGATPTRGLPLPLTVTVTNPNDIAACAAVGPFSPLSYSWSFLRVPPGSTAILRQADTAAPSFVPDALDTWSLVVRVTDPRGNTGSTTADLTVAADCLARPVVSAITPAAATTGKPLQLAATTTNPNATAACGIAGAPLSYAWLLAAQPPGSFATLGTPGSANPSLVPDVDGPYTVQLRVTDALGSTSAVFSQDVTVALCTAPLTGVNVSAVPAGGTLKVNASIGLSYVYDDSNATTASCGLTGTATTTPVTTAWTLVSRPPGSAAGLSDSTSPTPTLVPDKAGAYVLQVRATDALGNAGTGSTTLAVAGCGGSFDAGVTVAATTLTPELGQPVQLSARVTDANASGCGLPTAAPFSYAWTLTGSAGAAATTAVLSQAQTAQPIFTPDLAGNYDYKVVVTDALGFQGTFASTTGSTVVARTCALTVTLPASAAVPTRSALQVTPVVSVNATPGLACGAAPVVTIPVAYAWTFDSMAPGSTARFNDATLPNPSFTLDRPSGSWTVRVTVTDLLNGATAAGVQTYTSNTCFSGAPVGTIGIAASSGGGAAKASVSNTTVPSSPDGSYTLAQAGGGNGGVQLSATGVGAGAATTNPNQGCATPPLSLNYKWSLYQVPPASQVFQILPDTAALPVLSIDVTGTYVIQMIPDDGVLTGQPVFYRLSITP